MVNYQDTVIYRIPVGDRNYYGHTAQALYKRKSEHKKALRNGSNQKVYTAMREANMTDNDIVLVLVEKFPCKDVEEARARERYFIEQYGDLNTNIPGRSKAESAKNWREANIETVLVKDRVRGKIYTQNNREKENERIRRYRQENKEKVAEWKKKGYEKNQDKIKEARMVKYHSEGKVQCVCGFESVKSNLTRHLKTAQHKSRLAQVQTMELPLSSTVEQDLNMVA